MKFPFLGLLLLLLAGCHSVRSYAIPATGKKSAASITSLAKPTTGVTTTPLLLQMGDAVTTNPQWVYFTAAMLGDRASLAALRKRGADINCLAPDLGETALHQTVLEKNLPAMRLLLEYGADPNSLNSIRVTPLYDAIGLDYYAGAQLLLEHKADPNAREPSLGFYPLHAAASAGDTTATALLLKFGAKPNVTDFHGVTPLHLAVSKGLHPAVRELLAHGADPSLRTAHGRLAMDVARDRNDPELIRLLKNYSR